jgi:hypothetical protein
MMRKFFIPAWRSNTLYESLSASGMSRWSRQMVFHHALRYMSKDTRDSEQFARPLVDTHHAALQLDRSSDRER